MEILVISFMLTVLVISNVCVVSYLIYTHDKPKASEPVVMRVEPRKAVKGRRAPLAHDDEVLWQKEVSEKKSRLPFI